MIPIAWLAGIGLAAVIGGGAYYVFKHWSEIKAWIANTLLPAVSKVIRMLGEKLSRGTKFATDLIAQKLDDYSTSINHELYYQKTASGGWKKLKLKSPATKFLPEFRAESERSARKPASRTKKTWDRLA